MFKKFKQKLKERRLKRNQKLKEQLLKRQKKKKEILLNSLKSVLSYEKYTEVISAKSTAKDESLKRYAKLTNVGEIYIIAKDSFGEVVSESYMDIEMFCEDYSIKDTCI